MEQLIKLTRKESIKEVREIYNLRYDNEAAHDREDGLMEWFIMCCATGLYTKEEVIKIGKIVSSTQNIDFTRWTT